jgi:hypothetical protein
LISKNQQRDCSGKDLTVCCRSPDLSQKLSGCKVLRLTLL